MVLTVVFWDGDGFIVMWGRMYQRRGRATGANTAATTAAAGAPETEGAGSRSSGG